jgi:hypothetical protein
MGLKMTDAEIQRRIQSHAWRGARELFIGADEPQEIQGRWFFVGGRWSQWNDSGSVDPRHRAQRSGSIPSAWAWR